MTFYERFSELCEQKGIPVSRACTEMGMNPSITWRWKQSTPSARTLGKLSKYFGMSVSDILGEGMYIPKKQSTTQTGSLFDFLEDEQTKGVMQYLMSATPEQRAWLKGLLDIYDGN